MSMNVYLFFLLSFLFLCIDFVVFLYSGTGDQPQGLMLDKYSTTDLHPQLFFFCFETGSW